MGGTISDLHARAQAFFDNLHAALAPLACARVVAQEEEQENISVAQVHPLFEGDSHQENNAFMTASDSYPIAPNVAGRPRDSRSKPQSERVSYCSSAQPASVGASYLSSMQQVSVGVSHTPTQQASAGVSYSPTTQQAPLAH